MEGLPEQKAAQNGTLTICCRERSWRWGALLAMLQQRPAAEYAHVCWQMAAALARVPAMAAS